MRDEGSQWETGWLKLWPNIIRVIVRGRALIGPLNSKQEIKICYEDELCVEVYTFMKANICNKRQNVFFKQLLN